MESEEHRTRAKSIRVTGKDGLRRRSTIHYQNRNISELDLKDVAIILGLLLILLCGMSVDVQEVPNHRPA
jgi:hypothetical protein